MLKRMVMWRGVGAGGNSRADGLRGRSGRLSRGGLVGEEADEDEELALPALPRALLMVMVMGHESDGAR
jgi:hypothetical protein